MFRTVSLSIIMSFSLYTQQTCKTYTIDWFPCVYKQMLRWFLRFQVATTCFSCSPPDLNLVVTNFVLCIHVKKNTATG